MEKIMLIDFFIFAAVLSSQFMWDVAGSESFSSGRTRMTRDLNKQLRILREIRKNYRILFADKAHALRKSGMHVNNMCVEELNDRLDISIDAAMHGISDCYSNRTVASINLARRCTEEYKFHFLYVKLDNLRDSELSLCKSRILNEDPEDWRL